jgi:cation diffusion facilitator family transporter
MKNTEKAEVVSIGVSIFMAAGMLTVAAISHSVAILAEGTDTLMDIVASIGVLIGLKLSSRKTKTFPAGLYKLENVIAVIIGFLILFSSYELARESISRILSGEDKVTGAWLVMVVMAAVSGLTAFIAWYKGRIGKKENSPSLKADSKHSWTDAIASAAIILGVGLNAAGIKNMDSYTALVVVAILFWSGVGVIHDAVKVLLDASIEKDVLDKARQIAEADPQVRSVVDVQGRNSGSYRFLELAVVPEEYDLRNSEELAEKLRQAIRKEIENVDDVVFDFTVEPGANALYGVPLDDAGGLAHDLASASSFEMIEVDPDGKSVVSKRTLASTVPADAPARGARQAVFLARRGLDVLVTTEKDVDSAPYQVLDANEVKVVSRPDIGTLAEVEVELPQADSG